MKIKNFNSSLSQNNDKIKYKNFQYEVQYPFSSLLLWVQFRGRLRAEGAEQAPSAHIDIGNNRRGFDCNTKKGDRSLPKIK